MTGNIGRKVKLFLINAASLAGVNVLLRAVAVSFNAYVSMKIGEEGVGLFTLVMSVYALAVCFATSGVNLAAMRTTAEKMALLEDAGASASEFKKCAVKILLCAGAYSLLFGTASAVVLYFSSPFIAERLLCDTRTLLSLRVLSFSLVPISLSSALSGYFTGVRKVYKNAANAILEQLMKIVVTSGALAVSVPFFTDKVEYSCLAVVGGAALSEAFSLFLNVIFFICDTKRPAGASAGDKNNLKIKLGFGDISAVALPVALGAYVRQGLSTIEHLSIPRGLRKSGSHAEEALADYGVLQGMVFPLLLFPSAVLSSAAGLLIPELAECRALKQKSRERKIITSVYTAAVVFSVGCAAVFLAFSDYLGVSVYGSETAGEYIKMTAVLVPIMYFDIAVDCMLKGVGEHVYSMRVNIIDSALSLLLVLILVPRFGMIGYVISVYACEGTNCIMSVRRLKHVTDAKGGVLKSLVCAIVCAVAALAVTGVFAHGDTNAFAGYRIVMFSLLYVLFAYLLLGAPRTKKIFPNSVENSQTGEYNI